MRERQSVRAEGRAATTREPLTRRRVRTFLAVSSPAAARTPCSDLVVRGWQRRPGAAAAQQPSAQAKVESTQLPAAQLQQPSRQIETGWAESSPPAVQTPCPDRPAATLP